MKFSLCGSPELAKFYLFFSAVIRILFQINRPLTEILWPFFFNFDAGTNVEEYVGLVWKGLKFIG